jgi:hypothetical protein
LTHDFNGAHNYSTTPTSRNYFQTSQKLVTAYNNSGYGILKQIIIVLIAYNNVKCNYIIM